MPRPGLPKLIATDLDGTLVRSDDSVSAYTHSVLDRVREAGIPVVGATGRGPRLTQMTRNDIRAADYLVLAGGARVVDLTDPAGLVVLRDERLDGDVLAEVLADLEAEAGPLTVMVEALDEPDAPLWGELDPTWRYPNAFEPRSRAECVGGRVIKAFVRSPGYHVDDLLAMARRLVPPERVTFTQAGLNFVEINAAGVDKATGLAVIAQALGLDPAEVLVFGDMPNDVPMFRWAGWGCVAVANAHPEVRAIADEVTFSNDEDGVARYLNALLSNGRSVPAAPGACTVPGVCTVPATSVTRAAVVQRSSVLTQAAGSPTKAGTDTARAGTDTQAQAA